ncbi:hypothetical protein EYF80_042301 [Liparis tanakae]|uniref:Uncharacterized protein n=1 Tax=Liparis tanakae TaxID=230148 RepID=A0A4Z2G432_9TELE|nr:hypothetical protein EYF80_042301 [Liparis tanakae]
MPIPTARTISPRKRKNPEAELRRSLPRTTTTSERRLRFLKEAYDEKDGRECRREGERKGDREANTNREIR